jgi:anti-sigma factor RsiW
VSADDGLSCRRLVELVTEYLDGALPGDQARRFEAHVHGCADCARYVDQLELTVRALRDTAAGEV